MLDKGTCLRYYKRKEIQEAMLEHALSKEVGLRYGESFGKRPDILMYPQEILELAKRGATSFHTSEEIWSNPKELNSELSRKELDELRIGWDLVLDIDCKFIDYSKICAHLVVQFLKYCGVENISCKFSVTGDTPLLVKFDHKTQLLRIDDIIKQIKDGKKGEVLSLNYKNQVCYSPITDFLEHHEEIYQIFHENSKLPIKITKHHSLFVWDKGAIIQKETRRLNVGDFLVTFRSADYLWRGVGYFKWEFDFLKKKINRKIPITKELLLLLGYYLAEGHITKKIHQVGFSFNVAEEDYIHECVKLLKRITKKNISIRHPNSGSTQILIHSKEWYYFFEKICGKGAKNKHVPDFSWELPRDFFIFLLQGYIRGDGYKSGKYSVTIKSVSHGLIRELVWLCKLNHISCSLNQELSREHLMPQGTLFKGSHAYTINIPKSELGGLEFHRGRNKFSPHPKGNTFPLDGLKEVYSQIKPKLFNHYRAEQMTLRKKFANLERINKVLAWFDQTKSKEYNLESQRIIDSYKNLGNNDIIALRINKIKKENQNVKVYDISVKDTERFFGGEFPILLHNSGNKGFHLGVPFEAFPQEINYLETKNIFPEAPKKIAFYLKENIKEQLAQKIMDFEGNDFSKIMEKTGAKNEEIIYYQKDQWGTLIPCLNVEPFLEIDTILIASRHLYRMPYSLHEKSGLVSLPIDPEKVLQFEKNTAHPDLVSISPFKFLDREKDKEKINESARRLLLNAWDFEVKTEEKREAINLSTFEEVKIESPIKEDFFPPCIKQILANGMIDGRKRAVFILMNFLGKIGWEKKEIENYILKWNAEKNKSPLPENYIRGQIKYFTPGDKLPPNCDNEAYYKNLGVCHPDALCGRLKNPVNYTILRWKRWLREKEEEESKGKRSKSKDSVSKRELEKEENKKDKEKKE